MAMSAVGYPEPSSDPLNKIPKFCSRCRKELMVLDKPENYDPYTGNPKDVRYLSCPTLNDLHDIWIQESYGAWVNYGRNN